MLKSPTATNAAPVGGSQQNITEIIQLLESNNINVIEETSTLVRDSLSSSPEPWLLNGLVDYYITSGNALVRRLLTGIRQPQHNYLLSKIDDYLQKPATRYSALNLFGHIVRKDPTWIHYTVHSRAFSTILKCLQLDNDISVLTIALYVVSTLFPKVPTQMGPSLNLLFGIYVRLVAWKNIKHSASKLNLANFNVALYTLFLCLYGMYPCSFINYLQQYYCKPQVSNDGKTSSANPVTPSELAMSDKEKKNVFQSCIVPMLQQVRLHPNLILYSRDIEVLSEKWRKMESYDIVAEISQLRLDLKENLQNEEDENKSLLSTCKIQQTLTQSNENLQIPEESPALATSSTLDAESCMIWSPSMELGLSTPPPSRNMSPTHGQSNDGNEEKSKLESSEGTPNFETQKGKSRPSTLVISGAINRGLADSTPSTPTQGIMSFEFEKGAELLKGNRNIPCDSFLVLPNQKMDDQNEKSESAMKYSTQLILSHASGEDEFVDITCENQQNSAASMQVTTEKCITDFSPALQPSAEMSNVPSTLQKVPSPSQDALFIDSEKPSVDDILQLSEVHPSWSLSPYEIMQREIQLSAENQGNTNWTHFGVGPMSEKDSRSLRASILQMQCALLYEQHRREQHAMRARRLMRKIYETSAIEEKNKALQQIIVQKENELKQLNAIVRTQKSEFRSQEADFRQMLEASNGKIASLADQLKVVTSENTRLKNEKEVDMTALKNAEIAAKSAKSDMYKCRLQLESELDNKQTIADLNQQVVQMQRELLIVEELGRKMETIEKDSNDFKFTETAKYKMLIESYKKESEQLTRSLREKSVERDFLHGKAQEMDKMMEKKDRLLKEQKKYLENVKSLARSQIQAMEAKYQAQKNITMHMELQVMEQYSKLAALEGHSPSDDHTLQSKSKPIQQQSLGLQSRYGHLMEASPELSPPVKACLLEETSVATSELEASTGTDDSAH